MLNSYDEKARDAFNKNVKLPHLFEDNFILAIGLVDDHGRLTFLPKEEVDYHKELRQKIDVAIKKL